MTKRARSPVLGYNHNLRHGGRVFHVQTEDSGQSYARLYTHLFYEGTILASKKHEYDPEAPEEVVRGLMQKLHKAMIKELTGAMHDRRIAAFFLARGEPAVLTDGAGPAVTSSPASPPAPPAPATEAPAAPPVAFTDSVVHGNGVPNAPASTAATASFGSPSFAPTPPPASSATVSPAGPEARRYAATKPRVVLQRGPRRPPVVITDAADGVVVRRNVVIDVGAGHPVVHGSVSSPPTPPPTPSRSGGGYAVRDGAGYVAGNRARAAPPPPPAQPPPAVPPTREFRMPWETPGPARVVPPPPASAPPTGPAAAEPRVTAAGKIRMPWDPPPPGGEGFAPSLVSDKRLDEVILEYLADDAEPDER